LLAICHSKPLQTEFLFIALRRDRPSAKAQNVGWSDLAGKTFLARCDTGRPTTGKLIYTVKGASVVFEIAQSPTPNYAIAAFFSPNTADYPPLPLHCLLESVRRLQAGLQSFLSMRRIEASVAYLRTSASREPDQY